MDFCMIDEEDWGTCHIEVYKNILQVIAFNPEIKILEFTGTGEFNKDGSLEIFYVKIASMRLSSGYHGFREFVINNDNSYRIKKSFDT